MTTEEILQSLCYYDKRNPDRTAEDDEIKAHSSNEKCYCDNCFYGRTKLANELLKRIEITKP